MIGFRPRSLAILAMAIAVLYTSVADTQERGKSQREKLREAIHEETDEVYGDDINDLSDREVDRVKLNIDRKASELARTENRDAAKHVIDEWGDGLGDESHLRKCPLCYDVAKTVGRGTDLERSRLPMLQVPTRFEIRGAVYVRDRIFRLYRVVVGRDRFGNLTETVIPHAEGVLIFEGTGYFGLGMYGQLVPANPLD